MKISKEDRYLGAALIQVAEDDSFTAINPLKLKNRAINNAFLINTDTCLFLKHAETTNSVHEYQFTFTSSQLDFIEAADRQHKKIFIGLVCVSDNEICCIDMEQLSEMLEARKASAGNKDEESYAVLVTVKEGQSLRAFINAAGRRGVAASREIVIARNRFPKCVFQ